MRKKLTSLVYDDGSFERPYHFYDKCLVSAYTVTYIPRASGSRKISHLTPHKQVYICTYTPLGHGLYTTYTLRANLVFPLCFTSSLPTMAGQHAMHMQFLPKMLTLLVAILQRFHSSFVLVFSLVTTINFHFPVFCSLHACATHDMT